MKKIYILGFFLLIFSFSVVFLPNTASAEIEGYSATITCKISLTEDGDPQETEAFNSSTRTLSMDYSNFLNGGKIYLSADLIKVDEMADSVGALYTWTIDKVAVSHSKELVICSNYTLENSASPQVTVGNTKIILTIFDANSANQMSLDVVIIITDTNSNLKMNCATSKIPNILDKTVTDLYFYANIPSASKQLSYMWQLKTPNSTTYLTASNTYNYVFSRAAMLGDYGYGEYKLIAIGKDAKTNKTYYSETYSLFIDADHSSVIYGGYQLIAQEVKNTLTNIEAHKYSLSNIDNLIPENIYWYINDNKVGTGYTFTYEPTTRAEYKLSVKYSPNKNENPADLLLPIKVTPKATGLHYMYITIGTTVLVLSVILFISIKVSNKKRDVIW